MSEFVTKIKNQIDILAAKTNINNKQEVKDSIHKMLNEELSLQMDDDEYKEINTHRVNTMKKIHKI
jgi:hemoglobin-like flavoprotein